MAWIDYNGEKYTMAIWRIQCSNCSSVVQTWNGSCNCGIVKVKDGQRTWPYYPAEDVSIWKSPTGKVLPQRVLDTYFLRREANKTSTDTEPGTGSSGSSY